jgi:hypothetical protein
MKIGFPSCQLEAGAAPSASIERAHDAPYICTREHKNVLRFTCLKSLHGIKVVDHGCRKVPPSWVMMR